MVRFYVKDSLRKPDPEPVKVNPVRVFGIGTALWAVVLFALLVTAENPEKARWVTTGVVGIALGLLGLFVTHRRR